jgi:hypothetical protein
LFSPHILDGLVGSHLRPVGEPPAKPAATDVPLLSDQRLIILDKIAAKAGKTIPTMAEVASAPNQIPC